MIEIFTSPIELLGLLATFFVVSSFLFNNIRTVRKVNMCGSALFIIYALFFQPYLYSIIIVNGILFCINAYKLYSERKGYNDEFEPV